MPNTKPYTMANIQDFLMNDFNFQHSEYIKAAKYKSGFSNLDRATSLVPGLYVLGAISSLGKTTFMLQMAHQIAEAGQHVLYFSMEQSVLELTAKSLSRIMAQNDPVTALSSQEILSQPIGNTTQATMDKMLRYAERMTFVECSYNATISTIENIVHKIIATQNIHPIVFVDYLQVIQPEQKAAGSTKEIVDANITRLKRLQAENQLVMFVISSLNRQNYLSQIDAESFKESGGIEYTADVLWGLQLEAVRTSAFSHTTSVNDKRNILHKAKNADPRKVELVCLKNRFGKCDYTCHFDYFPQHDWFVPTD